MQTGGSVCTAFVVLEEIMEVTMKNTNQLIGCCGLDCENCDARIAANSPFVLENLKRLKQNNV